VGKKTMHSKAKGVTKAYKKTLDFQEFKKCIESFAKAELQQYHIRSSNHVVKTLAVKRAAFSSFDDKRYRDKCFKCPKSATLLYHPRFLLCPIHSVAYGSHHITEFLKTNKCMYC
jgi:hypothetical protein